MQIIKKFILSMSVIVSMAGAVTAIYVLLKKSAKMARISEAYKQYYYLMLQWMVNVKSGQKLAEKLIKSGYEIIGIYGFGSIACDVIHELEGSDVEIKFIADKKTDHFIEDDILLISPDEIINYYDEVDAIIVTPVSYYDEIHTELEKLNVSEKLVSLQDIIFEN